jgi:DNA-directed RNA polymerase specialized sigma24 family protein
LGTRGDTARRIAGAQGSLGKTKNSSSRIGCRAGSLSESLRRERELHARITPALRRELLTVCRHVTNDNDLAEDAVQGALVQAWRKPEALAAGNERLLRVIARKQALMVLRDARRHNGSGAGARLVRIDDCAEFEGTDDDSSDE